MNEEGEYLKHYDEYTIELHLLGSAKVAHEHDEIEKHLKVCYSCRELAEELHQFHAAAGGAKPLLNEHVGSIESDSLELRPEYVQLKNQAASHRLVLSFPAQLWHEARRRPFATAVSGFALIALAVTIFYAAKPSKYTNPTYFRLNEAQESLEVFNQQDETLWQLPLNNYKGIKQQEELLKSYGTSIADLDGDGRNEVITTARLSSEDAGRERLKVFDAEKQLVRFRPRESVAVSFRGIKYSAPHGYVSVLVENIIPNGERNVFVTANNGRSPWFLDRLDSQLGFIGRYWHFGAINGLYSVDIGQDGKKELVICGLNQAEESGDGGTRSFAALLDPVKLEGVNEASATKGFEMPTSEAELFYVRLPESDMNKVLSRHSNVALISVEGEANLRFWQFSNAPDHEPQFEYIFTKDLQLLEVKRMSGTFALHAELKREGKLTITFDQDYLGKLAARVEYWDGNRWGTVWTGVNRKTH